MEYIELKTRIAAYGTDTDQAVFWRAADGGDDELQTGVAYNFVETPSGRVSIVSSGDRGDFFQRPDDLTDFDSIEAACDWVWLHIRNEVDHDSLSDDERWEIRQEAQASIDRQMRAFKGGAS
jgi:hypothetical protein